MKKNLREKIYCEEVTDCPADENVAVFAVGCADEADVMYLACQRDADFEKLFDWLADMLCGGCNHTSPECFS